MKKQAKPIISAIALGALDGWGAEDGEDVIATTGAIARVPSVGYPKDLHAGLGYIAAWSTIYQGSCVGTVTATAYSNTDGAGTQYVRTTGVATGHHNASDGDRGQPVNFGFYHQAQKSSTGDVSDTSWLMLPKGTACGFKETGNNSSETCYGHDPKYGCPPDWDPKIGTDSSAPAGTNFAWCEYRDDHTLCPVGSASAFANLPSGTACGITDNTRNNGRCLDKLAPTQGCPDGGWVRSTSFYDAGDTNGHGIGWCVKP